MNLFYIQLATVVFFLWIIQTEGFLTSKPALITEKTLGKLQKETNSQTSQPTEVPNNEEKSYFDIHCPPGKVGMKCRKEKRLKKIATENLSFDDKIAAHELKKRNCEFGEYFDISKNTCEKCDNYCNEDDLTTCGQECRVYFVMKTLTKERDLADQNLKDSIGIWQGLVIVLILIVSVFAIGTGVLLRMYLALQNQVKSIRKDNEEINKRSHGVPRGDREEAGLTESDQFLPKKHGFKKGWWCWRKSEE